MEAVSVTAVCPLLWEHPQVAEAVLQPHHLSQPDPNPSEPEPAGPHLPGFPCPITQPRTSLRLRKWSVPPTYQNRVKSRPTPAHNTPTIRNTV